MSCEKKIVVEVMFKAQYCLICVYMDQAIQEILPKYGDIVEYHRVDILKGEGKKRFLDLSISLFGKEGVFKQLRLAPVPSMFINGELFFDAIPPKPMLEEALEGVIDKHNLRARDEKGYS